MKNINIQVLSCENSNAMRLQSVTKQLLGIVDEYDVDILNGIVPGNPECGLRYDRLRNRKVMNRRLSATEIAAYLSHRNAWQNLLNSPYSYSMILEDDFKIENHDQFHLALANCELLCDGSDIIKLFDFPNSKPNPVYATREVGGLKVVSWRYPTAGAVAYIISKQGAEKLLVRDKIFRPVDEDFKNPWELDLIVDSLVPSIVSEISYHLGGSLIDDDRINIKSRKIWDRIRGNLLKISWKLRCYFSRR